MKTLRSVCNSALVETLFELVDGIFSYNLFSNNYSTDVCLLFVANNAISMKKAYILLFSKRSQNYIIKVACIRHFLSIKYKKVTQEFGKFRKTFLCETCNNMN